MNTSVPADMHRGPSLLAVSVVYLVLFVSGLVISTRMAAGQTYVSPFASETTILEYFRSHANAVRFQAFIVFSSAIPLGIYGATVASRLSFLGVKAAGPTIALFGGLGASFLLALSGVAQWVLSRHAISTSPLVALSWQDFAFMAGGPGYASLLGLLIAGVAVPSYFFRFLPRWLCLFGVALGLTGQLSLLSLLVPGAVYFVPATRFLGFAWLIVCGAKLPRRVQKAAA